jgi:K+-sensing histidine kinase KdpD
MLYSRIQRPGVYETNKTSRAALPFFRSKRLLSLHRLLYSYTRGKTNLGGEGETKVKVE